MTSDGIAPSATNVGDQVLAELLVLSDRLYPQGDKRTLAVVLRQYEKHGALQNRLLEENLSALGREQDRKDRESERKDREQSRHDQTVQDSREDMAHRHKVELIRLRDQRQRFWGALALGALVSTVGLAIAIFILAGDPSETTRVAAVSLALVSAGGGGSSAFRSLGKLPKIRASGDGSPD